MHPSVHAEAPGKCPICGMDLVPVMKKSASPSAFEPSSGGGMQGMAGMPGMQSGKADKRRAVPRIRRSRRAAAANWRDIRDGDARAAASHHPSGGRLWNRTCRHHWAFVARVDGYVQELFISSAGQVVEKDAPLLSIYSPDLLTTSRELVMLLRMRDEAKARDARATPERLIASAESRLRQWNITDEQIAELERTRQPTERR